MVEHSDRIRWCEKFWLFFVIVSWGRINIKIFTVFNILSFMSPLARWRCSLWRQCSHETWKPSSLAEWLAQPLHQHDELLASTIIIDRQNGKDCVYNIRLEKVAVATNKCWVKISVEISRMFYIFWIYRQRSMIMVEASNSSWTKNDFEIASFFPRGNVGANYFFK